MGGSHPNGRLGMLDTGTAPHSLRVCWAAEPPPRYWGTSGHGTDIVIWSFLTHSGISRSPIPDLRTSARSRFRAGRWCSLSIGAWLPAPRRIMAAQCAEPPDVLFADLPAAPADGRATGSRSPSAARASMMMAFGRLLALNSGLGVGALYPLARGCRRRAGSWPLSAPSRRMFFLLICRRRRPMAELRGRGRRAPRAPA